MSHHAFKEINGGYLDIHAGGVDLKFPHHENEEAQSCAHLGCQKWSKFWIHTGHLNIKGLKMSKSLKNFITIKEVLQNYTSRQIRLCFILHKYNATMDYDDATMEHSIDIEKIFVEYFRNVKVIFRKNINNGSQRVNKNESNMLNYFEEVKININNALCDDFNTPKCINLLTYFVKVINMYVKNETNVSSILLNSCTKYITKILDLFGLLFDKNVETTNDNNKEKIIEPFVNLILDFRNVAKQSVHDSNIDLMNECDRLRDNILPNLGIKLEDNGKDTIWKFGNVKELLFEIEQREIKKKHANDLKSKNDDAIKSKTSMTYLKFDDDGVPTHDSDGKPLSKSLHKKLTKKFKKSVEK
jgi:cysteinyl-tRNA synthetase